MNYKDKINELEQELIRLENELREVEFKLQDEHREGVVQRSKYDPVGDHYYEWTENIGQTEKWNRLAERHAKLEDQIKETKKKLREAKQMAPIEEAKEQKRNEEKEARDKKKAEEKRKVEESLRKYKFEDLKAAYKRKVPRRKRIALAWQGRSPKWRQIKKLSLDELKFLEKASFTSEQQKQDIKTRDDQIKEDIRDIRGGRADLGDTSDWDPYKYAEERRKDYFLKLLRVRTFLEEEKKRNAPGEIRDTQRRTYF